jgi:putative heme-binding domain-containing protein
LAFLARRVLERMPTDLYRDDVLNSVDTRVAIVGMLGLINADPTPDTAMQVLERCSQMMTGFLSDADFTDLLRVCQVALHRGKIDPSQVEPLRDQIAEEFPAGDRRMNHELIRLAAYLQADSVAERALKYIESDAPLRDRVLVGMCLQFISHDWTASQRFRILKFYENVAVKSESGSLPLYMTNVTRDFSESLSEEDAIAILEQGDVWRNAALAAIYKLPRPVDDGVAGTLRELDRKLIADPRVGDVERRLRTGIIAMLATSTNPKSSAYLRRLWRNEPERRGVIAMALSVHPDGENWDYLVRSLNILEDAAAEEVVKALRTVQVATDDPMAIRQLILLGLRAQQQGDSFEDVEKLLEHWTGMTRPEGGSKTSMSPWQRWYAKTYPDRPPAVLPKPGNSRWDFDQLANYIDGEDGRYGDPIHGSAIFEKATCAECHRFGNQGESIGPDLTGMARRYTRREIIESILYPGHVVNSQYASKKVLMLDGSTVVGMVTEKRDGTISIRDSNRAIVNVPESDVDQILPSTRSIMPSGLLDDLSLQEISDLMAHLGVLPPMEVASKPE